jgi:MarR family transcriptional regulator, transcriptional regulator for hemolysin
MISVQEFYRAAPRPPCPTPTLNKERVVMSSPHSMVGFLMHDVARMMRKRFEQRAAHLGFTRSQWQVLMHLAKNEGINQAGLADILEVEPITLVRILDRLETRGLVERRRHATDRRVWLLYLTPEAHPSLSLLRDIGELTRSEALDGLSGAEQEQLVQTLTRMKANLIDACTLPVIDREATHG